MADKRKQMAVNMLSGISVFVLNLCVSFFLTPFIVKKLGAAAYGFIGLSNNIIGYSALLTVAVNTMAARFVTIKFHEKDSEGANRYLSSVFFANLSLAIIIMAALIVIDIFLPYIINITDSLVNDVRVLFIMLAASSCLGLLTGVFAISTFIRNRLEISNIRNLVGTLIRVILMLVLFGLCTPRLWYCGIAALVMETYMFSTNYYFFRRLTPELKIKRCFFHMKTLLEVSAAGAWNIISRLSGMLSSGFDLLLANIFVSARAMGLLSITQVVPVMILGFFSMFSRNFEPEFTRLYAVKDYTGLKAEILRSIRLTGFLSSIPLGLLFGYGDIFYRLWLPTEDATLLYRLSCLGCMTLVFSLPQEPLWCIFTITNKVRKSSLNLLYNSIATFATVITAMFVIKDDMMRLMALAGIRTFYGAIRVTTFLPIHGAKSLGFGKWTFYPLIVKNALNILLVSSISIILKKNFLSAEWSSLFIGALFTTVIALTLSYYLILNDADRSFISRQIKSKLNIRNQTA